MKGGIPHTAVIRSGVRRTRTRRRYWYCPACDERQQGAAAETGEGVERIECERGHAPAVMRRLLPDVDEIEVSR